MTEGKLNSNLLASWKEIASYLDCDVRTCRRWEKLYGLPVHRLKDAFKSRIHAYRNEIEDWLKSSGNKRNKSIGLGSLPKILRRKFILIIAAIFVILFLIYFTFSHLQDNQPVDFRMENSNLVILNKKGKELWRYDTKFENILPNDIYKKRFQQKVVNKGVIQMPLIIIKDIDNDKTNEVLFSIETYDQLHSGKLFLFDYQGKIRWCFQSGKELKYGPYYYSNNSDSVIISYIDVPKYSGTGTFTFQIILL